MTVGGASPWSGANLIAAIDAALAVLTARGGFKASNIVSVGNVGGGTDNLITYSLPANTLDAGSKGVRITAWGTSANNAAAKTLRLVFGTTQIYSLALQPNAVNMWSLVCVIMRTISNNQKYSMTLQNDANGVSYVASGLCAEVDTAAITIKCTGAATSNNDILQDGLVIEVLAA